MGRYQYKTDLLLTCLRNAYYLRHIITQNYLYYLNCFDDQQ